MSGWLKLTDYHFDRPKLVVLVSPHGSSGRNFFELFKTIDRYPAIAERSQLWQQYLRIEQDYGATELAQSLAQFISRQSQQIGCRLIEFDYPRGLIDGGRILEHCLRPALPHELARNCHTAFLDIHRQSLEHMQQFYRELQHRSHILIDIHTMASFCPHSSDGHPHTIPVSWENLPAYVQQFTDAHLLAKESRKIDLISADESGETIADDEIRRILIAKLQGKALPFAENKPYYAAKEFLMYHHMTSSTGIAIDIPKHFLARQSLEHDFQLDEFDLDQKKLQGMAELIASALFDRWQLPNIL